LCGQKCDADIQKCITTLLKGLPGTYQRILSRIVEDGHAEIVNKSLRWIAAAKRPLLLGELREVIATKIGDKYLERDRLVNDIAGLVSWCGNLVTLDEEDDLVQVAHHTIKQFLLSEPYSAVTEQFHFQPAEINHAAGEACVTYLNFNDFKRQIIKTPKGYQAIQPANLITSTFRGRPGRFLNYGMKLVRRSKPSKDDFNVIHQLATRLAKMLSPI
jgi:hypothetical protein